VDGPVANKDQLADWIEERLGGRGEKRRAAIRNAVRIADERQPGVPVITERDETRAAARKHPPSDPVNPGSTPPLSAGGKTVAATPAAREEARKSPARAEPKRDAAPSNGRRPAAAPDPTADLERLARHDARPRDTSTVTAVVIVCALAATAVGLYLWETERREVDVPEAPAAP
jgi:hypothetical protein